MAPEYGATMGFFPVDEQTLTYLRLSGRDEALVATVEKYCKEQGLWRDDSAAIVYTDDLEIDLSTVEASLAGPRRPQDRIPVPAMKKSWHRDLEKTFNKPRAAAAARGETAAEKSPERVAVLDPEVDGVEVTLDGKTFRVGHGSVVIAAITSCTNTSNPEVMVAAGLVARKARQRGLTRKPWVKTSLAPGSKVVTDYFDKAGLTEDLEALGFHTVGYGCTTCIGNSGPLPEPISRAIQDNDLVAAAVLSGNRNFEGRISPDVRANYLASPPLVVAYALAGTVDIDLQKEPLGLDGSGKAVYLADVWPTTEEIQALVRTCVTREQFRKQYANVYQGSEEWRKIEAPTGALFQWDGKSTYVQEPPFFVDLSPEPGPIQAISSARVLCKLGDSVTTDHISPAGSIKKGTPAAKYLDDAGVSSALYNSYGSRRGNDRVMTRGTFANIRVKNQIAPETEGGFTTDFTIEPGSEAARALAARYPEFPKVGTEGVGGGTISFIFDAAASYRRKGVPLVVLAGVDYGMGSSRDWAAKGTFLLGVRAVIARSFERIHRSNLVGMGVLPLCFKNGESPEKLGLTGVEVFDIALGEDLQPRQDVEVVATCPVTGKKKTFTTVCRIDTPVEVEYYRNGGILHTVLRRMARG
jgi:aconitate hydratase